ncbi:hypothetical protein DID75_04865 [Candidatus Marinamargulisbacteria bacterium SCGC AG-410-N11]|nr:hypothetical protein DID75_04865 [Candidatus Marinamargulisbacteria bacterium SCGC AG-410-N11]
MSDHKEVKSIDIQQQIFNEITKNKVNKTSDKKDIDSKSQTKSTSFIDIKNLFSKINSLSKTFISLFHKEPSDKAYCIVSGKLKSKIKQLNINIG